MWTVMVIGKATGRSSLCRVFEEREDAERVFLDLKARTAGVMAFELDEVGGFIEGRATTTHLAWTDLGRPMGGLLVGGSSESEGVIGSQGVTGSAAGVTR